MAEKDRLSHPVAAPPSLLRVLSAFLRQKPLLFEFSLCLSRACLGKMIIVYKKAQKWRSVPHYLAGSKANAHRRSCCCGFGSLHKMAFSLNFSYVCPEPVLAKIRVSQKRRFAHHETSSHSPSRPAKTPPFLSVLYVCPEPVLVN